MNSDQYREQWSTLTGRSTSAVYVPEALRRWEKVEGARVWTRERGRRIEGTITTVLKTGTVRVKWDDGSISHEGVDESGRAY